ncbi:MAG: transposase, partial [Bacteroidetes bacterium]|nr:transposase [Bacteroidota bacterium]
MSELECRWEIGLCEYGIWVRIEVYRRRNTNRLVGHDYSQPGEYFVTMCTKDREDLFGEITGGEMKLNEVGEIAVKCWKEIPQHYPNIKLDEFVVMPNHVHGI